MNLLDVDDLPAYTVRTLRPRAARHCVVIPVINEGERIRNQLRGMAEASLGADIIIVDGGSTDGSVDEDFLRACNVRTLLVKTGPGRLSSQLRIGFYWALQDGYEGIVTIDGNGKDDYTAIPAFIRALDSGYDFVQGSRYIPGGHAENTPLDRAIGLKLIHAPLMSLAARHHYTDTTNGFRAFSRRFLVDPRVRPLRAVFSDYNLHYYLSIRAARLGFRVTELPVTRRYPKTGPTPSKIGGISGKLAVLRQLFAAVTGKYNPET